MKNLSSVCAAVAIAGLGVSAHADEVMYWNGVLLDTVRATSMAPPRASRAMAMVHGAVYDAVNAVDRTHRPLRADILAPAGTSREAAAACAAHRVMVQLFPSRQAEFDTRLADRLALIPAGPARDQGLAVGDASAAAMIGWRSTDGSGQTPPPWTGNTNLGQWRPTDNGLPGALPHWGTVTPFVIQSGSQFRSPQAPALTGAEYAAAYNEVKALGSRTNSTRTQDQTDIANFWAANAGTVTPPGMWTQIAQVIGTQRGNTISENARMFAMVGAAVADAGITAWDTKYTHNFWRPETGIRLGESDGNPLTQGDPSWQPLLVTPNHPSLTSGHSTFSSAAAAALAAFLGTDAYAFTLTSEGITRSFASLSGAAAEAGQSRIYGGIHWQFDNQFGLAAGANVGRYVADNAFQIIPAPGVLGVAGLAGLVALRRRR
jgi:hypothetical protein